MTSGSRLVGRSSAGCGGKREAYQAAYGGSDHVVAAVLRMVARARGGHVRWPAVAYAGGYAAEEGEVMSEDAYGSANDRVRLRARIELLETALRNATQALTEISTAGSRESLLLEMADVRRFATNRAKAALEVVEAVKP